MWEEAMVEDELDGNGCMSALCAQVSERFSLLEGPSGGAMPRRRIMSFLETLALCICLCASRVRQRGKGATVSISVLVYGGAHHAEDGQCQPVHDVKATRQQSRRLSQRADAPHVHQQGVHLHHVCK